MEVKENIKGFVPTSLVDWDGKVSAVLFLGRCNFKCGFCSNKELVLQHEKIKSIQFENIKDSLEKSREFIDGIVITGGEPTIYPDIGILCEEIKNLGFKVKLDTNGSNPDILKELLQKNLVDFVAMDIKTSFENYKEITGSKIALGKIKESILIVSKFPDYEFRTTIAPRIVNNKHVWLDGVLLGDMADWVQKKIKRDDSKWYIQKFVSREKEEMVDERFLEENLPEQFH